MHLPLEPKISRFLGGLLLGLLFLAGLGAAKGQSEDLPPKPSFYFTDRAGVVDAGTAQALNQQLAQFERDTSNQILVAIFNELPDQADVAQYSIDTFNAWQVGQKGKDNGAVLFVYIKDRKMFICTGRGLEGALPDATCKDIISQLITPQFRDGKYSSGIMAGVTAMIAATKGEYQGTGKTRLEQQQPAQQDGPQGFPVWAIILFILFILISRAFAGRLVGGPMIYTGGGFGGGGFGGGGFSGGGGGGFSGGGGGFGGGGGSSAGGGAGGGW